MSGHTHVTHAVPNGSVMDAEGCIAPQIVAYQDCAESIPVKRDGRQAHIIGFVVDAAGEWHPVTIDPTSPVPSTWFGARLRTKPGYEVPL